MKWELILHSLHMFKLYLNNLNTVCSAGYGTTYSMTHSDRCNGYKIMAYHINFLKELQQRIVFLMIYFFFDSTLIFLVFCPPL